MENLEQRAVQALLTACPSKSGPWSPVRRPRLPLVMCNHIRPRKARKQTLEAKRYLALPVAAEFRVTVPLRFTCRPRRQLSLSSAQVVAEVHRTLSLLRPRYASVISNI